MLNSPTRTIIVRYYEEVWNRRRLETIADLLAPSYVGHERNAGDVCGLSGVQSVAKTFSQNFPDATFTIVDMVGEGNTVAVHLYFEGVNHATNRPVKVSGMIFVRLVGDKIVESWSNWDELGMFQQMGGKIVFEE